MQKLIAFLLFALVLTGVKAEPDLGRLLSFARRMEIAPMSQEPDWLPSAAPCFSIAWVSDLHIIDDASRQRAEDAFDAIRDTLHANAVMITGDNCGLPASFFDLAEDETAALDLARHKWFRAFVQRELPMPCLVIPGDNWPWTFTKVFKHDKFSFDFGGFHFVFMSRDEQARGYEGCQRLLDSSLAWLAKDLDTHAALPTLFVMHEPLMPPTFLDANKVSDVLSAHDNVLLALGGHLHLDLQFKPGAWTQWCCPSVGRSHRPAFKLLEFHKERIVMTSYERDAADGVFRKAMKWQTVSIPERFQASIRPLSGFAVTGQAFCPNQGCKDNPELSARSAEIKPAMVNAFLKQNSKK